MPILGSIGSAAAKGFGMLGKVAAAVDEYFKYVTLLLHGNGTNGAQNNTFLDSSTNNFTITRNGNTTQGTFTPYGANWSNYFGTANGNAITFTAVSMAGDFTIEYWVFPEGVSSSGYSISFSGSTAVEQVGYYYSDGRIACYFTNGANGISSTGKLPMYAWSHVAIVRSGSTVKIYVNGVDTGVSITYTATLVLSTISGYSDGTAGYNVYGSLSNIRIGSTAVYTSNFTPPTAPLSAISGTLLLTCQSNRFVDNSASARTLSRVGSPSVQRFSPFNPTAPYAAGTIGGSGYFDGSGDYLNTTTASAITGDCTIEGWMYHTGINGSGYNTIYAIGDVSVSMQYTGAILTCYFGDVSGVGSLGYTPGNALLNCWTHFAVVRSGTSTALFINGTRVTTSSRSGTIGGTSVFIGSTQGGTPYPMLGYIADFKFTNGTANYSPSSTTITIPTAPSSSSGSTVALRFTNSGIIDNAMMNDLETVGNAQISTSVSKFGGGSISLPTSAELLSPSTPNLLLGSTYTIEGWFRPASSSTSWSPFRTILSNGQTVHWVRILSSQWYFSSADPAGNFESLGGGTVNFGAWQHVAICVQNNNAVLYVDGISVASRTLNPMIPTTFPYSRITSGGGLGTDYIDDLRITKGVARYTANFTPPAAPFADQ